MPDRPRRTWSAAEKAAYREFVRAHHPDAGGDAEAFREGLARFHQVDRSARQPESRPAESVSFVVRRRGLTRVLAALAARRRRKRRTRVR
ncbi:hypothetical protein AB0878_40785 [Amycolatopsis sp. NPDC047767]|uniref:hypothetical protein n=1 Tax=Amycolatopsis sp. NPDC047767 TaxID=3156765 RepID=UPI003453CA26